MHYLRFELPASPEAIYEWLTEDDKLSQWTYPQVETRYQKGDTSSHNAGRFTRSFLQGGKLRSSEGELLASEPPFRISYRLIYKGHTRRVNYQLERHEDGATYLTYSSDCQYHDQLGLLPLFSWWLEWRHRRLLSRQVTRLRHILSQQ